MKKVKELLAKKTLRFNTISAESRVIDALALMKTEGDSYVIVMEKGNYIGVMSERDYSHKIILAGKNSSETKVKDIMTKDMPVVDTDESIDRCMELMLAFKTHYLPAFDEFEFKGVITLHDLMNASMEENKRASKEYANFGTAHQHYWI